MLAEEVIAGLVESNGSLPPVTACTSGLGPTLSFKDMRTLLYWFTVIIIIIIIYSYFMATVELKLC